MDRSKNRHAMVAALLWMAAGVAAAADEVTLWLHVGAGPERRVYEASIAAFHAQQKDVRVTMVPLPEGSYAEQVKQAADQRRLPCLLDLDGPLVSYYAWATRLVPLDDQPFVQRLRKQMLRTLESQGSHRGRLYSLAQFDSGLALWGNRRLLEAAGIRIPAQTRSAWTHEEFESVLQRLKAQGVPWPLDMKLNYGIGEWLTYGFSPIVQSFGGDLIDRRTYRSAQGVLNSPASVRALQTVQKWVRAGYLNPKPVGDSDFVEGRSALSHVGHWVYQDYRRALGDDLVLIPMPRFGSRAVTGAGSWSWAVTRDCARPDAAMKVLEHLMSHAEVLRVTQANGAVPGTVNAIAFSPQYGLGGPLRLYVDQIVEGTARVRPPTPAYPVITQAFARAVARIIEGADVQRELDEAVRVIDEEITRHEGYPSDSPLLTH
ncbi:extracellular solute-binding protein [Schlegelella sp. S2-27]|uniref:Extracellular solute-binding protein n=1 Tax=Caldimonas mangrovi TaxID=2944811 RepID=A0ABT0YM69_9BURK|nr:extracellular solute-binding protein [Caldimonas mangrovi]MCM5679246.1 extracellular solute-binding protein [Caldimonas mangrovi]